MYTRGNEGDSAAFSCPGMSFAVAILLYRDDEVTVGLSVFGDADLDAQVVLQNFCLKLLRLGSGDCFSPFRKPVIWRCPVVCPSVPLRLLISMALTVPNARCISRALAWHGFSGTKAVMAAYSLRDVLCRYHSHRFLCQRWDSERSLKNISMVGQDDHLIAGQFPDYAQDFQCAEAAYLLGPDYCCHVQIGEDFT